MTNSCSKSLPTEKKARLGCTGQTQKNYLNVDNTIITFNIII